MKNQISKSLASYLYNRVGELLRGVIHYEHDEFKLVYLRDDIREQRYREDVTQMLGRIKQEGTTEEEQSFPFGELHATIRAFDETIFMHFPIGEQIGVVVALEPDVAQNLNSFIDDCLDHIYEEYPSMKS
ncbi:DUF7522 family protein [Halorussus amylolyticus]|uniref:DUF7522 family protein n=1 Tax=Halorussus amylolyticus TaxID=1126242 RepID=UPI00104305D0|nr:hypothetical protein [Halorussus amylolyticus]